MQKNKEVIWKMEHWKSPNQNSRQRSNEERVRKQLKDLWDNIKYANLCIIRIPEGEERERGD